jgi:hypothetical protein
MAMKKSGSAGVGVKPVSQVDDKMGGSNGPLPNIPGLWREIDPNLGSKSTGKSSGKGSEAQRRLNLEQYML